MRKPNVFFLQICCSCGSDVNPDNHCSCLGVLFEMFLILPFFSFRQQLALTSYQKPCIWRIEQWVRFLFSLYSRNEDQHLLWWCTVLRSLGSTDWALISWLLPAWPVLWGELHPCLGKWEITIWLLRAILWVAEGAALASFLEETQRGSLREGCIRGGVWGREPQLSHFVFEGQNTGCQMLPVLS